MSLFVIDPATGGVAGLYLESYLQLNEEVEVVAIGAHASWTRGTRRIFYRRTDLAVASRYRLGILRLPLRYMENVAGLMHCLLLVLRKKPDQVWYALSSILVSELMFIVFLRFIGVRVSIICHDVIPLFSSYKIKSVRTFQRSLFYKTVKTLIVHNKSSVLELQNLYKIDRERIRYLPFPIMDLRRCVRPGQPLASDEASDEAAHIKFLFIGHIRSEKGVDLLIKAWRAIGDRVHHAQLTVAGSLPAGSSIGNLEGLPNFTFLNRYIDEDAYVDLISAADVIVFPYRAGTNSGVLSNVVSLGKPIIASDIEMFKQSGLVPDWSYFEAGNWVALASKLEETASLSQAKLKSMCRTMEAIRDERIAEFRLTLRSLLVGQGTQHAV